MLVQTFAAKALRMVECTICSENFSETDEVVSTSCGHIFHKYCLQESMRSTGTCPLCRTLQPTSHPIFLNFNQATEQVRELEANLEEKYLQMVSADESHAVEVSALETQLERNEKVCFELQAKNDLLRAQLESEEQQNVLKAVEIHDLQMQLQALVPNNPENEGLQRALSERDSQIIVKIAELNDLTQKMRLLTEHNTKLRQIMQGSGTERMQALVEECAQNAETINELKLKLKREAEEKVTLLEQKNTLQEKLKQMEIELQREIRHSAERSANAVEGITASVGVTGNNVIMPKVVEKTGVENVDKSISNGVIIKGFNGNLSPLAAVLKLAHQMQLCVGEDDVEEAVVKRRSNDISLIVGFKTSALKDSFLVNAAKLKYYADTRHLEFCAYSGANTDLLAYAKKLESVGFKYFYIRNNFVFARWDNKSTPIKIFDKEAVDKMMTGFEQKDLPQRSSAVDKKIETREGNGLPSLNSHTWAAKRQWRQPSSRGVRKPTAQGFQQK